MYTRCTLLWSFLFGVQGHGIIDVDHLDANLHQDPLGRLVTCDNHGGICPAKATCCPVTKMGESPSQASGCVPSDLGSFNATCCQDDTQTACGISYNCRTQLKNTKKILDCVATEAIQDPLVQELPRYHLCTTAAPLIQNLYGLPIVDKVSGLLAYYSSHGDLIHIDSDQRNQVRTAIIVVHGATRNADEYFCSMATAAERFLAEFQNETDRASILVLSPRFANLGDDDLDLIGGGTALQWKDDHDGAWRYGSDAVYPFSRQGPRDSPISQKGQQPKVSSFDGIDTMVQALLNTSHFRSLERLVVVGHSAGGQLVQRWALLTPFWENVAHGRNLPSKRMHAIVANPSSYCYLIPERWANNTWQIPGNDARRNCPDYNKWKWGLDPLPSSNKEYGVRYVNEAMHRLDYNLTKLKYRFLLERTHVVYMIGAQDRCNVSQPDGWCKSHGLETTCGDELQGRMRLERHNVYYESLGRTLSSSLMNNSGIHRPQLAHKSLKIAKVGHDHSLMFHSPQGMHAIFGKPTVKEDTE